MDRSSPANMLLVKRNTHSPRKKPGAVLLKQGSLLLCALLFALFGSVPLHAAPSDVENLQTAYDQAASSSPAIAQARAQLDHDLAGKPLSRAALLPHINAGASGGMNTARVTGFGPQPISTAYHSDVFSASLTESIFDGQAFTAMRQSESRIRASQAALAYAQLVVALQVTQAYFGILQAQANQRVAQQQMDLLQSIDRQTRASLHVGSGDIISVQEAQAQLDAARADLITANNAVTVAKNQLQSLTHQPIGTLQDITTLQPMGPQPDTIGPWLRAALKNQPLLQQARATLKLSEQQVQYARRARWPTLTLSGIGQRASGTLIPPLAIDQIGASLNLSIPIYQGGSTRAGIHQAEALSRANRASLAGIQDQIKLETQTAFQNLQDSVAQFQATQQSVASAKVSMEGTRKGYQIGSRSIIDLLTATTSYAAAQRNYYLALYTQLVARTQLKAAAGVLSPADIKAINALLESRPSK
ncbi:MAG: TolC family outer membrane protein [Acidobacteriaceae bacterium]